MRKTLLVFLAVTLIGAFASAEVMMGGEASISGSVTLTAGYDLDTQFYGFRDESDIQIVLPILDGEAGASGDDSTYAEITINGIGWEWSLDDVSDGPYDSDEDSGTLDASISATIHFGSLYMKLGNPGFEINKVNISTDYLVDAYANDLHATSGFTFGFMNDMFDVAGMVASENDWRNSAADDIDTVDKHSFFNNDNDEGTADAVVGNPGNFVYGAKATITPVEGISIPVMFLLDPASKGYTESDQMAFGGAPSVEMGGLTFTLPFDYLKAGDKTGLEVMPTIDYELMEGLTLSTDFLYGTYTNVLAADIDDTALSAEGKAGADVVNPVAELAITLADTGAFIPELEWSLALTMGDMMDYVGAKAAAGDTYTDLDIDIDASYDAGGLKPSVGLLYSLANSELDFSLGVDLSADFTGIDNTTIMFDYVNDAIVNSANPDKTGDGDATESGTVTLAVKVAF